MAVSGFRPVLGALALSTAGFTLAGDNAGFCSAILRKTAGSQPARLESLTYILPGQTPEPGEANHQPPIFLQRSISLQSQAHDPGRVERRFCKGSAWHKPLPGQSRWNREVFP